MPFCLPNTFFPHFSYPAENTLSPSAWMKIQKNQPVITTNSISKISRRHINAPSGLDMVLLVLNSIEIKDKLSIPPHTSIPCTNSTVCTKQYPRTPGHTHIRAQKSWRHFLRKLHFLFLSWKLPSPLEFPPCHYSPVSECSDCVFLKLQLASCWVEVWCLRNCFTSCTAKTSFSLAWYFFVVMVVVCWLFCWCEARFIDKLPSKCKNMINIQSVCFQSFPGGS